MYESFYRLSANPFRLVPDARLFYASTSHKRGLAYLRYGLHQGQGFAVVTGKPGTGKSTLVQTLFTTLTGESMVVAGLSSTNLGADDILQAVAYSFDVHCDTSSKASLLIGIESFLKARVGQGKRVVLVVDEAQNLPLKSLEELRMLSNFQDGDQPLLQILLLGQKELQEMLARPELEQLAQRVIASYSLKPLGAEETRAYIGHRLSCVGWCGDPTISGEALALIYYASQGVPRLINIFCDRLFLAASLDERHDIDEALAQAVLNELMEESTGSFAMGNAPTPLDVPKLESLSRADVETGVANASDDEVDDVAENQHQSAATEAPPQAPSADTFEPAFQDTSPELSPHEVPETSEGGGDDAGDNRFEPATDYQPAYEESPRYEEEAFSSAGGDISHSPHQLIWRDKKWLLMGLLLLVVVAAALLGFLVRGGVDSLLGGSAEPNVAAVQRPAGELAAPQADNTESAPVPEKSAEETGVIKREVSPSQASDIAPAAVPADSAVDAERLSAAEENTTPAAAPQPVHVAAESTPIIARSASLQGKVMAVSQAAAGELQSEAAPGSPGAQRGEISDGELAQLLFNLVYYYESGDLTGLAGLFSPDAVANGAKGREKIKKDYQALFNGTERRSMRVENVQWRQEEGGAEGQGSFYMAVWRDADGKAYSQRGRLTLKTAKQGDGLVIQAMTHHLR